MPWVKLDDRILLNPKIASVSKDAKLLYISGLCYAGGQLTDGIIPARTVGMLAAMVEVEEGQARSAELVKTGLWEPLDEGFRIHDYLKYNPSRQQWEELQAARAEAGRKGGRAPRRPKPDSNEANAKQMLSKMLSKTPSKIEANMKPVPVPVPVLLNKRGSSSYPPEAQPNVGDSSPELPANTTATPTTTTTTLSENWKPDGEIGTALALYLENFQLANPQQQRDLRDVEAECGREVAIEAVRWASRKGLSDTDKIWSAARRMKRDGIGPKVTSIDMDSISPDEYIALRMGKHP